MNSRDRKIYSNCFSVSEEKKEPSKWNKDDLGEFLGFWNLEKLQ